MIKTKFVPLLLIIFKAVSLCAQPTQTQKFLPVMAPPTPEAAGMTRYGNYQVNLFTGTPDISIPIYEVKVGELTVPISLSYHASGIKVNEVASRAGLGWDLQAGGAITRKVMGKPDEVLGNYLDNTPGGTAAVKSGTEIDPYTELGLDYLNNVDKGIYDVEPDIFSYSFPGHSGKFLFNQRNSFKAFLIPYAPITVNYNKPTSNNLRLSINDESGITYKFDSTESTNATTTATSSWMLSDMISANQQDTVHFVYSIGSGITDSYFSDYIVLTDNCTGTQYNPDLGTPYSSIGSTLASWQQLNEIRFKNGKIVFEASPSARQDYNSAYQLQHGLTAIRIYSYDGLTNIYKLLRSVQFYQSYFISGTDASTKRLTLDSLQFLNANGTVVQSYQFTYNTSVQLPVNTSRMKDYWGYFNNINNLRPDGVPIAIPKMQVSYNPGNTTIWIGGDHTNARDPDPNYMQANILQKISFPTGGYTQFEYETNQYLNGSTPTYAGGLRIKSIKSYSSSTAAPIVKTYKYGVNQSGYGRNNFFLENYFFVSTQNNRRDDPNGQGICPGLSTETVRTFFANPTNDLEGYDGAAVVYPEVTEYTGDSTVNIGKTVYKFNDKPDARTDIIGYGKPIFDSYHFVRGLLTNKVDYKKNPDNSYSLVAESRKKYQYFPFHFSTGGVGLVTFKQLVTQVGSNDADPSLYVGTACDVFTDAPTWYRYNNYDLPTGDNKLVADTSIVYDQNDPTKSVSTITSYTYDDTTHLGLTQTQTVNSKGETITTSLTYPYNYGTTPYTTMTTNHIFDKVVQQTSANNGTQLTKQLTNYADFGNSNFLPQTIQFQLGSNPIETRANFLSYDSRANPQEMQKTNDVKESFIWDYKSIYPIADVTNSANLDIAYTSFETEGKGNWAFSGLQYTDGSAPTGIKVYNLSTGDISRSGLNSSATYYVSYWSKNGAQTVSASVSVITGRTLSGIWTQYEHKVVNPVSGLINISGTGVIDELRLYPAGALMTTMTFDPLIGMTSHCDANNRINYYYYDEFGRLLLIRDQDKNALKKYAYNYSGKPENQNFYFNALVSRSYTRNNCQTYYTGSAVTYSVPAESYTSTLSLVDANGKAAADTAANGQAYANALGSCTYNPPMITVQGYNSKSSNYNVRFTNNTTGTPYYFVLTANTFSSSTLGQVPAGTYTVLFYPQGAPVTCTYDINGFVQSGVTGATFNNISVTALSTARMY